jgi:hypothetical protein
MGHKAVPTLFSVVAINWSAFPFSGENCDFIILGGQRPARIYGAAPVSGLKTRAGQIFTEAATNNLISSLLRSRRWASGMNCFYGHVRGSGQLVVRRKYEFYGNYAYNKALLVLYSVGRN